MKYRIDELTVHPEVACAWELPEHDSRFIALVDDIRRHGILEPLVITSAHEVVDGRHRLRAARALGIAEVPCRMLNTAEDAAGVAISSMACRRHLGKGQLAYAAYPLFAHHHAGARAAHTRGLRNGPGEESGSATVEDLAESIGISRDVFKQAARLHDLFAKDADLRAEWEPRIMADDAAIGLGAALAGIAGQRASKDRTPQRNSHLARWVSAWSHVGRPAQAWEQWDEAEREKAGGAVRAAIEALPDPLLDVVRDALRGARRARSGSEN